MISSGGEAAEKDANMDFNLKSAKVKPIENMRGEDERETIELQALLKEAQSYLRSFQWCLDIKESYFAFGIGGVVAIFLFRLLPGGNDIDDWLWVIVGDIPPAYITTKGNLTPNDALLGYIQEMEAWVSAVKDNQPVSELIPVNVPANKESAHQLKTRLVFLKQNILPLVKNMQV